MKKLVLSCAVLLGVALWSWTPDPERGARGAVDRAESSPLSAPALVLSGEPNAVREARAAESDHPLAEEPARATPHAIESEPTRKSLLASIEGRVSRAGDPVGGGLAWLTRCGKDASPWCVSVAPVADDLTALVGVDGTFRFEALEPGLYCAGVEVEPGLVRNQYWPIFDRESNRWEVQLGAAEIRGTVRHADGSPADGAWVWFYSKGDDQESISGSTRTGIDGGYELRGLSAGSYGLQALLAAVPFDPLDPQVDALELGADEVRVVDLGREHELAKWSARVLSAGGRPLPALRVRLELESREARSRLEVAQDRDGSFRRQLDPGTYLVTLVSGCGSFALGQLEMTERNADIEYRLPGTWVQVSIRNAGTRSGAKEVDQVVVSVAPRSSSWQVMTACPGDDGTWHFLDLAPGEYELWASRGGRRRVLDKRLLVVRPGDDVIEQELSVEH